MSEEAKEEKPILSFSGVLPLDLVVEESEDEDEPTEFKIFSGRGKSRRILAVFYGDKAFAINSMYARYAGTLDRVLAEAQALIKDPEGAQAVAEAKAEGKEKVAVNPNAVPLFAKPRNIVNN